MSRNLSDTVASVHLIQNFLIAGLGMSDTTVALIERLKTDKNIRRICSWESLREIPDESTFSRAFAQFSEISPPQRVHEALIHKTLKGEVVLHNARDSTAIEAREKLFVALPIQ